MSDEEIVQRIGYVRKARMAKALQPKTEYQNDTEEAIERAAKLLARKGEIRLTLKAPQQALEHERKLRELVASSERIEQLTSGPEVLQLPLAVEDEEASRIDSST